MDVRVVVHDGGSELAVDAGKVAGLFEATGDLRDWDGDAKLSATATQMGSDGAMMQFTVVPGDGKADVAFLRLGIKAGDARQRQTISFASMGEPTWNDRVTLSALASSGGPVSFEVASGPGIIEGNVLSFTGPGMVKVQAVQAGNDSWSPTMATQTVSVERVAQTISFGAIGLPTPADCVNLSAAATGGGTVTFEVVSGPGKIEGNVLSFTRAGTVEVRAVQAGDERWLPTSVTQTVEVGKQTISFALIGTQLATNRVELSATATGGGAVTFEVVSGPGKIDGNVLSFTGEGAVEVRALQAGDERWLPATATQMVPVVATYMVVDLSAGANAASYPVTYMYEPPSGGFNTDAYKTTKLVLRKIEAGSFTMGSPSGESGRNSDETQHKVTLTKPYYIGLFEVTQKQYALVMGSNPSQFSGDKRPVEQVSWNTIRGNTNWPESSFMGRIRARTGLGDFDLPTEAQWEYACRAGTTTAYSYGGSANGDYMWYWDNFSQTHDVGTKKANAWGLYDMHGNVWEWCLDWYASNLGTAAVTDPKGASSRSNRVVRSGGWNCSAAYCRSAFRRGIGPSYASLYLGFRLSRVLSE